MAGPGAGLAGSHLSFPPQVRPAQEEGADEGAEAEPQQQVHHQPRLLLRARLLLQRGRGRQSRDQGGRRRWGGGQGTCWGPGREKGELRPPPGTQLTLVDFLIGAGVLLRALVRAPLGKELKAALQLLCLVVFYG